MSSDNLENIGYVLYTKTDYLPPSWDGSLWDIFDERHLRRDLKWSINMAVVFMLVFLIGFVGNCMVILVMIKRPQMRTVTNLFIMNLAVADLLVIIICVPGTLLTTILNSWILGSVMCKVVMYMGWVSIGASAYSLAAISFNRCKAISRPQFPPRGLSKRQALITICLIWTFAMALTIPFGVEQKLLVWHDKRIFCVPIWENDSLQLVYVIAVHLFLFYCFPLIFILISNIIICWNVSKRIVPEESDFASRIHRMHRESRQGVEKMLGIVTLAFLLSWLPLYVHFNTDSLFTQITTLGHDTIVNLLLLLGFSNSSVNPILYAFLNKKFREAFKSLLPKWLPCVHREINTVV